MVKPILLRGMIILPNESFKNGYVAIVNGRIASVSVEQPNLPGAIVVNTNGIILPGFVDVHNHLRANVMPRWKPGRLYSNRYQWRQDPEFIRLVNGPNQPARRHTHFCDME
jgi:cytosine/adenosine deaminase-related metal-dependent hydrolase